MPLHAQLGTPTTTVKDTFQITKVVFNGTELNKADWPATIILEDAYVKGKAQKVRGGYQYIATCNGKSTKVFVRRPPSYSGSNGYYIIGDYEITVQTMEESRKVIIDTSYSVSFQNGIGSVCRLIGNNKTPLKESVCCQWELTGRNSAYHNKEVPLPQNNTGEKGTVSIKIWVNDLGKIVNAEVMETNTTISNPELIKLVMETAYNMKFTGSVTLGEQIGLLTYTFK